MKTLHHSLPRIAAVGVISLICLFSLAFANRASALNVKLDFKLHNATGNPITKVYVCPTTTNKWSANVLGEDVLNDGDDWDVTFSPKATATEWDIKAQFQDGTSHQWTGLDLSNVSNITLHYDAATNTTTAESDNVN